MRHPSYSGSLRPSAWHAHASRQPAPAGPAPPPKPYLPTAHTCRAPRAPHCSSIPRINQRAPPAAAHLASSCSTNRLRVSPDPAQHMPQAHLARVQPSFTHQRSPAAPLIHPICSLFYSSAGAASFTHQRHVELAALALDLHSTLSRPLPSFEPGDHLWKPHPDHAFKPPPPTYCLLATPYPWTRSPRAPSRGPRPLPPPRGTGSTYGLPRGASLSYKQCAPTDLPCSPGSIRTSKGWLSTAPSTLGTAGPPPASGPHGKLLL